MARTSMKSRWTAAEMTGGQGRCEEQERAEREAQHYKHDKSMEKEDTRESRREHGKWAEQASYIPASPSISEVAMLALRLQT
jgi:hypothetical protein